MKAQDANNDAEPLPGCPNGQSKNNGAAIRPPEKTGYMCYTASARAVPVLRLHQ